MKDLTGKTVFIAGGSTGLGRELAISLAKRGCDITIFARRQQQLEEARNEALAVRRHEDQEITVFSLDLADAAKVAETFQSRPHLPDILYCVAGGTMNELGFLADLDPDAISRCMTNNYLTSAYPAQAMLKLWNKDDKKVPVAGGSKLAPKRRQLVFISSAAAFAAVPGYTVYTPAECAVRALADTLRSELIRYSGPSSQYSVHIAFPSNFISPSFIDEQNTKPQLTKKIEGTTAQLSELTKRLHNAKQVADVIIVAVDRGDFVISSELEASLLFAGMVGVSPRRGFGIVDSILVLLSVVFAPLLRWWFDWMVSKDKSHHDTIELE